MPKRISSTLFVVVCLLWMTTLMAQGQQHTYRGWVKEMQLARRGPFSQIRWFCKDGEILPPQTNACGPQGGTQHGEWSGHTKLLRNAGYYIANTLAGLDKSGTVSLLASSNFNDRYNQLLIEKFLIAIDDGWIFRQARFYRGAFQEEAERNGAYALLVAMLGQKPWYTNRYAATRMGARMLAHGLDVPSIQTARQMATSLAALDRGFEPLRVKIHGTPDADDARRVREYGATGKADLQQQYRNLAAQIDQAYAVKPLVDVLDYAADVFSRAPWLQQMLRTYANHYASSDSPENRYRVSALLLAEIRNSMPRIHSPGARLRLLDTSLTVEAENFRAATDLLKMAPQANREQRLQWLSAALSAAYGTGQINPRLYAEAVRIFASSNAARISLQDYLQELNDLSRAPGWAARELRYQFYESMQKLAQIEPLAMHFIGDQLRAGPMLAYSRILNALKRDANHLAGISQRAFGEEIGSGLHALNPGIAHGRLYTHARLAEAGNFDSHGIYVLPATISNLPPVAGILTAGEGNPLSHVQLLARNLGIPNVSVDASLLPLLKQHEGEIVVLAVSPAGLVEVDADNQHWQGMFKPHQAQQVVIRPDLKKLDLSVRKIINLADLRATDSGRIVGPKAAKLGELKSHFPAMVAPGLGIPFGVFRETILDQPYKNTKQSVYDWMLSEYAGIDALPTHSQARRDYTQKFRAELHQLILDAPLGMKFQNALRSSMQTVFGNLDKIGVFVRSDTNVEDLPGFTGAGLNLTLPNVIGFDNVLKSINRVWASPFTRRAFAWRQSYMEQPQYVYPAVLLLQSVPNDKSGVLVTEDIDSGNREVISVAVNEGVGGAVDGQSAESLRINMHTGAVKVLATATAPWKKLPDAKGGVAKLPTSGSWTVLQPDEIQQIIQFGKDLPARFPAITDASGNNAPADVEFGFLNGSMRLFQLRPFLQSRQAQSNTYLQGMDSALAEHLQKTLDLEEVPD